MKKKGLILALMACLLGGHVSPADDDSVKVVPSKGIAEKCVDVVFPKTPRAARGLTAATLIMAGYTTYKAVQYVLDTVESYGNVREVKRAVAVLEDDLTRLLFKDKYLEAENERLVNKLKRLKGELSQARRNTVGKAVKAGLVSLLGTALCLGAYVTYKMPLANTKGLNAAALRWLESRKNEVDGKRVKATYLRAKSLADYILKKEWKLWGWTIKKDGLNPVTRYVYSKLMLIFTFCGAEDPEVIRQDAIIVGAVAAGATSVTGVDKYVDPEDWIDTFYKYTDKLPKITDEKAAS